MEVKSKRKNIALAILSNRGSSLVEMIVILPTLVIIFLIMWQLFSISNTKHDLIKAVRYMVWQKADYTGGRGGSDPCSTNTIVNNAKNMVSGVTFESAAMQNLDTVSFSSLDGAVIRLCAQCLGVELKGKWKATMKVRLNMPLSQTINNLIPGGAPVPDVEHLTEEGALVVDGWNVRSPSDDAMHGQEWDRMSGLFPLGVLDLTGGYLSTNISKIMQKLPLVPEPRKNLKAVPAKS